MEDTVIANEINGFSDLKPLRQLGGVSNNNMSPRAQKILGEMRTMVPETKESHRMNKDGSTTTVIRNAETNQIIREINLVQAENGKFDKIHSVTEHSVELGKNNETRQVKTTHVDEDGDGYADTKIVEKLIDGHWVADVVQLPPIQGDYVGAFNRKMSDLSQGQVLY